MVNSSSPWHSFPERQPCIVPPAAVPWPYSERTLNLTPQEDKTCGSLIDGADDSGPPVPPFTEETATQKVRMAEDAWNTREPARVALAYTKDSSWRNRAEFFRGRAEIVAFLQRKWTRELDYRLIKELWAFTGNKVSVRFVYEWHDDSGFWYRSHGNEQWEFDEKGLMQRREASINDVPLREEERKFRWPHGPRPAGHPGLTALGL